MSRDRSLYGASLLFPLGLKPAPPLVLASIDNVFQRPLLSFYNPLLDNVPDVDVNFTLLGPHHSVIEVDDTLVDSKHLPRKVDDELVMRMKRPIDLPDEDYQPDYATDDYSGLVDATSAMSLTSRHRLLPSSRGKHRECASAADARFGSARCGAAFFMEPPDTPRRSRPFGHARH